MYKYMGGYVEECCYDDDHIQAVIDSIERNFGDYFDKYIETCGGRSASVLEFKALKKKLGVSFLLDPVDKKVENFKTLIAEAYEDFEKDRPKYEDIFDEEGLMEWREDMVTFKYKVLKQDCPIIHLTIYNKNASELDTYRHDFSVANPKDLYNIIKKLYDFGVRYMSEIYDDDTYDEIEDIFDLHLEALDTNEYTLHGVIGGGIKSHLLYKFRPCAFANRSRSAIWALWFLTGKEKFGCSADSEFLMIDVEENFTQQNYHYPYELFTFYALKVYILLKKKAEEIGVYLDPEYRYVIVDNFLDFVAREHSDETAFFSVREKRRDKS